MKLLGVLCLVLLLTCGCSAPSEEASGWRAATQERTEFLLAADGNGALVGSTTTKSVKGLARDQDRALSAWERAWEGEPKDAVCSRACPAAFLFDSLLTFARPTSQGGPVVEVTAVGRAAEVPGPTGGIVDRVVIADDRRSMVTHRVRGDGSYLDLGGRRLLPVSGTGAVAHLSADKRRALVRLLGVGDDEASLLWLERNQEGWQARGGAFGRPSTWACIQDRRAVVLMDDGTYMVEFGEETLSRRTDEMSIGACVWRGDLQVQVKAQERAAEGARTYLRAQDERGAGWTAEVEGLGRLTASDDGSLFCLSTGTRAACFDHRGKRLLDQDAQDVLPVGRRTVVLMERNATLRWSVLP